jgi:hypothetical protein
MRDHDHWIALGVPATLVHAYAYHLGVWDLSL